MKELLYEPTEIEMQAKNCFPLSKFNELELPESTYYFCGQNKLWWLKSFIFDMVNEGNANFLYVVHSFLSKLLIYLFAFFLQVTNFSLVKWNESKLNSSYHLNGVDDDDVQHYKQIFFSDCFRFQHLS